MLAFIGVCALVGASFMLGFLLGEANGHELGKKAGMEEFKHKRH